MKIENSLTDRRVLAELGRRLERARLDLNLTQAQLAGEAGISKRTVERIEAGQSTQLANLLRVLRALSMLERLDVLFPEPLPSPVEQLRLHGKTRERASSPGSADKPSRPWTWGDER